MLAMSLQSRKQQPHGRDDDESLERNQQTPKKKFLFRSVRNLHNVALLNKQVDRSVYPAIWEDKPTTPGKKLPLSLMPPYSSPSSCKVSLCFQIDKFRPDNSPFIRRVGLAAPWILPIAMQPLPAQLTASFERRLDQLHAPTSLVTPGKLKAAVIWQYGKPTLLPLCPSGPPLLNPRQILPNMNGEC